MLINVEQESFLQISNYHSTWPENNKEVAAGNMKKKKNKSTMQTNHISCSLRRHDVKLHLAGVAHQGPAQLRAEGPHLRRSYAIAFTQKYESGLCCSDQIAVLLV